MTDEFLEPIVVEGRPRIAPGDQVVFFNFRPDRARQLTERLLASGFDVTTMTRYRDDFPGAVAFAEQEVAETIAEVLADHGARQLHAAETEKYAHVTYFFNGGREEEWPGEDRILVPSPRDVPSYDHKPEMSARELAQRFSEAVSSGGYRFAIINFANPDMVGHTGLDPRGHEGRRDRRRMPRAGGRRGRAGGRGEPDHRRPRECRAAARGGRRQPAYRAHD